MTSSPEQLASAAGAIATALSALPPEDREKVIDIARLMVPAGAVKPPKKTRSDAGKTRGPRTSEASGSAPLLEGNQES